METPESRMSFSILQQQADPLSAKLIFLHKCSSIKIVVRLSYYVFGDLFMADILSTQTKYILVSMALIGLPKWLSG